MLVGWDAADWRVINPLIEQGKMPNLEALINRGTMGNLATLYPVLSPMLWTSIATGKRPYKHGVHGFSEPDPTSGAIRPVTNLSRKTKAIWNILNQEEKNSIVVGWWPSHPVEPLTRGVMVSNHYQRASGKSYQGWPMEEGCVHPERLTKILKDLRFHPTEVDQEALFTFLPKLQEMSQEQLDEFRENPRLKSLLTTIADCTSIHSAATALMQNEPWDFMAVYYDAIDHFGHGFMQFHPPRRDWVDEKEFEIWKDVMESGYRYHDMMLGTLMQLAGEDTTIILMSDHGFHPDHLRPRAIPNEPAGPAHEHRQFGIIVAAGPGIKQDELIHGASVIDITPTILHQFGLPIGEDMDGKVLLDLWEQPSETEYIESWENVEGEDGQHSPDRQIAPTDSKAALDQLVALGYIEDPGEDQQEAIDRTVRELDYNLACAYIDGGIYSEAALILERLYEKWPLEHRFGNRLTTCYRALRRIEDLRRVTDCVITRRIEEAGAAAEELKSLNLDDAKVREAEKERFEAMSDDEKQKFQNERRDLIGKANPNLFAMHYISAFADFCEDKFDEALEKLEQLDEDFGARINNFSLRGDIYIKQRNWQEAKDSYQKALEIDVEVPGPYLGMARAFLGQGDYKLAIDHAKTSIGLLYHQPLAHYWLGVALLRGGDWQAAEKAFLTSNRHAPLMPRNYRMLKLIAKNFKNDTAAVVHYDLMAEQARKRLKREKDKQLSDIDQAATECLGDLVKLNDHKNNLDGIPETEIITIVSGLPRSGTSLVMQMLEAAGIPAYTDEERKPDESNPQGYFESQNVMGLMNDRIAKSWLSQAKGKTLKVVAPLLPSLVRGIKKDGQPHRLHYRIVFINRDISEVIDSQSKMLNRLDKSVEANQPVNIESAFRTQLNAARNWINGNQIPSFEIEHRDLLTDSEFTVRKLAGFLGCENCADAMSAVIRPELYRSKKGTTTIESEDPASVSC